MLYTILMREGAIGADAWRQYALIADERVLVVHMTPALLGGWRFHHVDKQFAAEWPGMTRDAIVAWKMSNDDGRTQVATLADDFRTKLIAYAEGRS